MMKAGIKLVQLLVALNDGVIRMKESNEEGKMPDYAHPYLVEKDERGWMQKAVKILLQLRDEGGSGNHQSNATMYRFFMRQGGRRLPKSETIFCRSIGCDECWKSLAEFVDPVRGTCGTSEVASIPLARLRGGQRRAQACFGTNTGP